MRVFNSYRFTCLTTHQVIHFPITRGKYWCKSVYNNGTRLTHSSKTVHQRRKKRLSKVVGTRDNDDTETPTALTRETKAYRRVMLIVIVRLENEKPGTQSGRKLKCYSNDSVSMSLPAIINIALLCSTIRRHHVRVTCAVATYSIDCALRSQSLISGVLHFCIENRFSRQIGHLLERDSSTGSPPSIHHIVADQSINRSIIQSSCGAGKESIKKRCLHDMQNNCGWWWSWNILFYTTDMHWDFSSLGYILRMQWTALYCLLQHFNDYKWPIDRQSMWEGGRERETHTKEQPIFIFTTNNNNIPIRRMFIGRINGTATTAQHPRDSYL